MIEYALRELIRRRRRTVAHTAGFAVAIGIITFILNVNLNGEAASRSVLSSTGTHFVAFIPKCAGDVCKNILVDTRDEGFYVGSTQAKLLDPSHLERARGLASVADVAPVIVFRLENSGSALHDVMISGIPLENSVAVANNSCSARDVLEGRFLTAKDKKGVVLEQAFAQSRRLGIGARITLVEGEYVVVGIVNSGIRPAKADVYMEIEQVRQIVSARLTVPLERRSNLLLVESRSSITHENAVVQVKEILGAKGNISSYNCYQPAARVMGINGTSASVISLVVFIFVLAFALQSQYSRVIERRFDIGILSAIGWSRRMILTQVFYESLVQSLVGWAIGSLIAVIVLFAIPSGVLAGDAINVTRAVYPGVFALSLLLSVVGGTVAGIFPGRYAVTRSPADCLRRQ